MKERPLESLVVLHSCNQLLAVGKPAGLPVVPDSSGDESLLDLAKAWVKREFEKPGKVYLGVVHRLDRPVSGVVLFARTSKAAARLSEEFREQRAEKAYLGVVEGSPHGNEGTVEQWLLKDQRTNFARIVDEGKAGAKRAVTRWRRLKDLGEGRTVLRLMPETGRAHQLRVAAASLLCPLLGDVKYGASAPLPDRSIALHAESLEVAHPTRDERVRVECPPPDRAWWQYG